MSEYEIQRRKAYKHNRKKWMMIQVIAIVLLSAIAFGSFFVYNQMNRTYYIEYTENSDIDYKVQYKENNFFTEPWVEKGQSYISSLIEGMTADFSYKLQTDATNLGFSYQYKVDAKLLIASKESGAAFYTFEETILPAQEVRNHYSSKVTISESVAIDYVKYNQMAYAFINAYDLKNLSSSTLIVTLDVDLQSSNQQLGSEKLNKYTTSLNIPLAVETFDIFTTSSAPNNTVKQMEYKNAANPTIFYVAGFVFASLAVLLTVVLFVFLNLTRNEDITYTAKIRRILRSYGTYIQCVTGEFDYEGYQIVMVKTFNEILGIRDTLQAPVLMLENRDETATRFFVPTNTKLLYVFEIKVDNYDEIYGTADLAGNY